MAIRAVMFDFGGVISSSPFEAFARLETERGLPPGFIRTVNATNPHDNAWARLNGANSVSKRSGRSGPLRRAPSATNSMAGSCSKGSGVNSAPRWWRQSRPAGPPTRTACLTNNFALTEHAVSEEVAAVYALFDAVLKSRVLGIRKPDPRFYELACARVGVEPEESVFLDDLGVNLKPARALGMHTIKVTDPDQALAELELLLEHPVVTR